MRGVWVKSWVNKMGVNTGGWRRGKSAEAGKPSIRPCLPMGKQSVRPLAPDPGEGLGADGGAAGCRRRIADDAHLRAVEPPDEGAHVADDGGAAGRTPSKKCGLDKECHFKGIGARRFASQNLARRRVSPPPTFPFWGRCARMPMPAVT